jgi:hypothetical protein
MGRNVGKVKKRRIATPEYNDHNSNNSTPKVLEQSLNIVKLTSFKLECQIKQNMNPGVGS